MIVLNNEMQILELRCLNHNDIQRCAVLGCNIENAWGSSMVATGYVRTLSS